MKKLVIILLMMIVLTSCGNNQDIPEKAIEKEKESVENYLDKVYPDNELTVVIEKRKADGVMTSQESKDYYLYIYATDKDGSKHYIQKNIGNKEEPYTIY